jgi:hypothetical protein
VVPGHPIKLKEGDFFGEMASIEHRRHKHDVVADTLCRSTSWMARVWHA